MNSGKGGLGSSKLVAFETLAWHNECFFCHLCKDSMVGKGFIQVRNERKDEPMDICREKISGSGSARLAVMIMMRITQLEWEKTK